MTQLQVDPFGGLAGDMFLAALLDLRRPEFTLADLQSFVDATLPGEATLTLTDVTRRGLGGKHLDVNVTGAPPMRHPADLARVVAASPLSPSSRERALDAIERLALVEAHIHRIPRERVHFHEIGAVDTVVDLAGAAFALERLGITRVQHAPPFVGGGTVLTQHGELPVPAPATAELLLGRRWLSGEGGERLTPTGAALLVAFGEPARGGAFQPLATGYGAGTRDLPEGPPNLVRVVLGSAAPSDTSDGAPLDEPIDELAFQLDDATGEEVAFLLEGLLAAGALDAWTLALGMKKGRPGVGVVALARPEQRAALQRVAFERSPTLGVRWRRTERVALAREELVVELEGHAVRIKRRIRPGGDSLSPWDLSPEYEDLAAWARASGLPLPELAARSVRAARALLE
ncbi:MAG: LarC family nickel insertion protein [Planctomycetota bacterium]